MAVHIEKKSLYYNLQCTLLIAKGFWFLSASWFRKLCTQQYIFQLQDTVLKIDNCTSVSHHLLIFPHYVRMLTMFKVFWFSIDLSHSWPRGVLLSSESTLDPTSDSADQSMETFILRLCHRIVYLIHNFPKQFVQIVLHCKRSFEILAVVNISYSYSFWKENIRI